MTIGARLAAFAGAVAMAVAFASACAEADTTTGAIALIVRDDGDAPVAGVSVTLSGPQADARITDAAGRLALGDLPPGGYGVVLGKPGFVTPPAIKVDVAAGRTVMLDVQLRRVVIGRITARPAPRIRQTVVDSNSAASKITRTVRDALESESASVVFQKNGEGVSLRGLDPSQTGFSIDGIDMHGSVPGALINSGLFSAASVDFAPAARALAGSVNYQTVNPTNTWQSQADLSLGGLGQSGYQFGLSGTRGKTGIAVQHGWHGGESPLTGQTFEDTSGLTYRHDGANRTDGDLLKLSYTASPAFSVRASVMHADSLQSMACSDFTTAEPCGYGPGVSTRTTFNFSSLGVQAVVRRTTLNATAYSNANLIRTDGSSQFSAGVPDPNALTRTVKYHGVILSAATVIGAHQVKASFDRYASANVVSQFYDGQASESDAQLSGSVFALTDKVALSRRFGASGTFSVATGGGMKTSMLGNAGLEWTPNRSDVVRVLLSSGSATTNPAAQYAFSDPRHAEIDCAGRTVFVNGPSERPVQQRAFSGQATWQHDAKRGGFTVTGFATDQYGTPFISALPLAGAANLAALPANYLDELRDVWSRPATCGSAPFDPSRIFAYGTLSRIGQATRGISTAAHVDVGAHGSLSVSYAVSSATITSIDPQLRNEGFTFPLGWQIPGRVLQVGTALATVTNPRAGLQYIANARFTGVDNVQNLPPYVVYNFGIVKTFKNSYAVLLAGNVFNAKAGTFATYRGINLIPIPSGDEIGYPSSPLAPGQLTLRYHVRLGR